MKRLLILLALGLALCWLPAAAWAQETTGTITGIVRDTSGGVIPGATVTVRNIGTNAATTLVADESGGFVATLLPPGNYEVTVELQGFKKYVRSGLELHVNDRLRVDAALDAGAVSETVTVTAESPIVQTQTSDISTLIEGAQVVRMPLNGRNIVSLVAMQPGVVSTLPSTLGVGLSGLTSVFVNGNRASQNNWMIDGADNNDVGSNLALINYLNVDSVAEVKILRSNYNAEFGRSGGAQVNVVTKSGSNSFSGSVYEFLRDDAFDARAPFSFLDFNGDGKADPAPLDYYNYGGTIGGPVLRDRLFFFWGEEFRKIRTVRGGGVNSTRVPTDRQKTGDFSEFPVTIIDPLNGLPFAGNRIPDNRIDPVARALLARFPAPNASAGGNLNFSAAAPQVRDFREDLVRIDYRLSNAHGLNGRVIHDDIPSEEPYGEIFGTNNAAFPGIANTATNNPGRSIVGTWNWVIGPRTVNELSYNYSRGAIISEITGEAGRTASISKVFRGAPGDDLLPGIAFSSGSYGGWNFFGPYDNTYGSHRIKSTTSHLVGKHALKFGFLYSHEFKNENAASGTNGLFTFPGTTNASFTSAGDAFADFLLGRASIYSESNIDITSHLRFKMFESFAQTDWKVRPSLTLNLGVRWSVIMQPTDTENLLTNFDPSRFSATTAYQIGTDNLRVPGTGDPLNGLVIAGQNSPFGERVTRTEWGNVGPRAGFSWDPRNDGRMAIRGGYGQYFDRTLVGVALQNAFVNPPFAFSAVFNASGANVPTFANPQAGAQRNNETLVPALIAMSPDFKIPTTHQFSLGMQRELPFRFHMDVAYVGTQGRNLLWAVGLNQTPTGTPAPQNRFRPYRGFGNITFRETSASSSYNSLQLSVFRRFRDGFQVAFNYTLSKAVSDSSSDRNAADFPQDVNNRAAERALATYDRTHVFGANYIWEVPFLRDAGLLLYNLAGGWEITGSTRLVSGAPLTITTSTLSANSLGGGPLRVDLVGDPEGPKTVAEWFNKAAFAQPAPNTFGNAPRSVVRGPGLSLTDLAIFKNFRISNRFRMQYRLEAFNVFNQTNYTTVSTSLGSATYGRLTAASEPRLIQMGFKFTF